MHRIAFNHGTRALTLPAPLPERPVATARNAAGTLVDTLRLRFVDLARHDADALAAFMDDARRRGFAFTFTDEAGAVRRVRAADDALSTRRAPDDFDFDVALERVVDDVADPEPGEGGEEAHAGWWRLARGDEVVWLPPPLPDAAWTQTPIQAVGHAADGTRHVHDTGRVGHARTWRFAPLTDARRDALAAFHAAGAGGRDAFTVVDGDGVAETWSFADGPLAFTRRADDDWAATCRWVRTDAR